MLNSIRKKVQSIPDRKRYIDFIAALFALPVMITVLVINIGNLTKDEGESTSPNSEVPSSNTIVVQTTPQDNTQVVTPQERCTKKVGPIEITSPKEGQTVTSNPVNILISYDDTEYCSVVWSYRINNGDWSEYTSNSISIYNPPRGEITLDLRVQSTASQDSTQLERTFEYQGPTTDLSPTIQESATPSPKI